MEEFDDQFLEEFYSEKNVKARFEYYQWERKLGQIKHQELSNLAPNSSVPLYFHLGLLFSLSGGEGYPAETIVKRLIGTKLEGFKSNYYAIQYARAISLIKLTNEQYVVNSVWPANLYRINLARSEVALRACSELALEEVKDDTLKLFVTNDYFAQLKHKVRGDFKPEAIIEQIEGSFSNESVGRNLQNYVKLKLKAQGMPHHW